MLRKKLPGAAKLRTPKRRTPKRPPSFDDDPTLAYLRDDPGDGRRLRMAIAVAVLVHSLLLAVPTLQSEAGPVEPEEERELIEIKPMRFKPPEPPPERPPEPRSVEIPVPAPTPDDIEPLRPGEPIPVVDDLPGWDLDLILPDGPPPSADPDPEPEGPILVGGDVDRPVPIYTPEPEYTEIARRARLEGIVILQLTLDKGGEVSEVKVLRGMGGGLTESAERAVSQWRYHPATLNGKPVAVYMTVTVHFTLQ